MKLEWPNVNITVHENVKHYELSYARNYIVKGHSFVRGKIGGLFGISEEKFKIRVKEAEELATYEMAHRANEICGDREGQSSFVTSVRYSHIPISEGVLMVVAIGQACSGPQDMASIVAVQARLNK